MDRKIIVNTLELAYAPLSGFEFAYFKEDTMIKSSVP